MADINVSLPQAAVSDGFISSSKGAVPLQAKEGVKSSQALTEVTKGLGSLFGTVVEQVDQTIKRSIDTVANEATDKIFNEFGVDDQTLIQGTSVDREPLPEEISRADKNLNKLTQAMRQGAITENSYWARVNSVSRQLRSRYPGHRDYIDQKIASIAGGSPQNQLLSNLIQESTKANSSGTGEAKQYMELVEKLSKDGVLPEDFSPAKYQDRMSLIAATSPRYRDKAARENEIAELSLKKDRRTAQGITALDSARSYVQDETMNLTRSIFSSYGKNYDEITKKIEEVRKDNRPVTPEEASALRSQFSEMRRKFTATVEGNLVDKYGNLLSQDERKDAMSAGLGQIQVLEDSLLNKDVGALTELAAGLEYQKSSDDRNFLYSSKDVRGYAALTRALPGQAGEVFLQAISGLSEGRDKIAISMALANLFGEGKDTSLLDEVTNVDTKMKGYGADKGLRATVAKNLLQSSINLAIDSKTPVDVRARAVNTLFGTKNANFIARLKQEERAPVFENIVNGRMHKAMVELRDIGQSEAWSNYVGWSNNAFAGLMSTAGDTLSRASTSGKHVVKWDSSTKSFVVDVSPELKNRPKTVPRAGMSPPITIDKDVDLAVKQINSGIRAMTPLIKEQGADLETFVSTAVRGISGITGLSNISGSQGSNEIKGGGGEDTLGRSVNFVPEKGGVTSLSKMDLLSGLSAVASKAADANRVNRLQVTKSQVDTEVELQKALWDDVANSYNKLSTEEAAKQRPALEEQARSYIDARMVQELYDTELSIRSAYPNEPIKERLAKEQRRIRALNEAYYNYIIGEATTKSF